MNKKLYEIDEILEIIPMSRAGIYLAVKKGNVPSVRVGGRVFIPAWYVDKLVSPPAAIQGA
ncbi:MAG: hypothetical protein P4N59_11785 [Negativicutes bacterium]|nr:hypothetical protein [Negativicutes bacterium]